VQNYHRDRGLSIGGLPLFLTDQDLDTPSIHGVSGQGGSVFTELELSTVYAPAGEDFHLIAAFFSDNFGLEVQEILWSGILLRLRLPDNTNCQGLPQRVGGLLSLYGFTSAIQEHEEAARRLISPTLTVGDDSAYTPYLRPGVMLSCGTAQEPELLTSSGVVVQDRNSNKYLTVATHGFPPARRDVYPPTSEGSIIGEVHSVLGDSDISLVGSRPGIFYASETFGHEMKSATKLTALRGPAGLQMGDILTMENSFSGYCEGMFVEAIWKALPVDENRQVVPWVILFSFFMGNGISIADIKREQIDEFY
jgi:hypothetical protein